MSRNTGLEQGVDAGASRCTAAASAATDDAEETENEGSAQRAQSVHRGSYSTTRILAMHDAVMAEVQCWGTAKSVRGGGKTY